MVVRKAKSAPAKGSSCWLFSMVRMEASCVDGELSVFMFLGGNALFCKASEAVGVAGAGGSVG